MCNHYGCGTAATFPIDREYYSQAMRDAFGGDGYYKENILVVYCNKCGCLLEVSGRKSTLTQRILWRVTGGKNRKSYKSLPFLPDSK